MEVDSAVKQKAEPAAGLPAEAALAVPQTGQQAEWRWAWRLVTLQILPGELWCPDEGRCVVRMQSQARVLGTLPSLHDTEAALLTGQNRRLTS